MRNKNNRQINILIIRFKSIGDIILTLPAVHALRANFPEARITYLTRSSNAALLQGFREVDRVITTNRTAMKTPLTALAELFRLIRLMRAGQYTHVADLQGYGETAWLSRLTGAPNRWSIIYSRGRKWAYTRSVERNSRLHPVERDLQLLQACGLKTVAPVNRFHLPEPLLSEASIYFAIHHLDPESPTLLIHPFTSAEKKNWPLEKYLAVAEYWRASGIQVIFTGSTADREKMKPVLARKFPVFTGQSLLISAGLLKLSTLVLGGDTGMLHLAVAQGKRTLMLFNNRSAGRAAPFQHNEWVIDISGNRSIKDIPAKAVIDACGQSFPAAHIFHHRRTAAAM
ncbi:glycosyltransferase family 9 protein [Pontiella sp.]|uniref:glycosyltransferase family 9 protein n=1 Tax=Pontiella sp. TaxID=2837462 RepID=UPI0035614B5C